MKHIGLDVAAEHAAEHAHPKLNHLRTVIFVTLAANRFDEPSLRSAVLTYVGAERAARTPLGQVITLLTELIDASNIAPMSVRHAIARQVTLWSVERYYSYQGDDPLDGEGPWTGHTLISN